MADTTAPSAPTQPALRHGESVRRTRGAWLAEGAWTAATMLIALLVAAWVLKLWDAKLHVPFYTGGDANLNLTVFKGIIEHGWYYSNSSLGAPFGQQLYDFSGFDADNLQFLILRILAFGTGDPAALMNVYYVLGFPLIAGTTYLVLRNLGISRPTALVCSVLLAVLPFHFARGQSHLFVGTFFAVPAAGWLVVRALLGRPFATPSAAPGRVRRWITWPNVGVAAACIAAGGSTLYHAVFAILLLGAAMLVRALATRSLRGMLPGLLAVVAVGGVLVVNLSPALVYRAKHGSASVAARQPVESERFGGSLIMMVTPIQGHRVPAFARAYDKHQAATPLASEGGQNLGLALSIALLACFVLVLVRTVRPPPKRLLASDDLVGASAMSATLAFLIGTTGGVSAIIAYYVTPQLRAWNRITPYVAFFALIVLAVAVDRAGRWIGARWSWGRLVAAAGAVALLVLGSLDQTSFIFRPPYESSRDLWRVDADFGRQVQAAVPPGGAVFQLPFHAFPETAGVNKMADYDLFDGYLHTSGLHWSYGAMKGRPEDWSDEAERRPLDEVLTEAAAAGFDAVYVDRWGYDDFGRAAERTIRKALGVSAPVATSADQRLVLYDARPLRQRLETRYGPAETTAAGRLLTEPLEAGSEVGIYPVETDGKATWQWVSAAGTITVNNRGSEPHQAIITARATAAYQTVARISVPGAAAPTVVRFLSGPEKIRIPFAAPPGKSEIKILVDGKSNAAPPDTRDLRMQLFDLTVGDRPLDFDPGKP